MPAEHSVISGLLKDAKAGVDQINQTSTRETVRYAEMGALKNGLAPDGVKRAGMLAAAAREMQR